MRSRSRVVARPRHIGAVLAVAASIAAPMRAQAPVRPTAPGAWGGKTKGVGHYADVNGIKLYYEIGGTGRPLILLHGGLGAIEAVGDRRLAGAKQRMLRELARHDRSSAARRSPRTHHFRRSCCHLQTER